MENLDFSLGLDVKVKTQKHKVSIEYRVYNNTILVIFKTFNVLNETFRTYKNENSNTFFYDQQNAKLGADVYMTNLNEEGMGHIRECFNIYKEETNRELSDDYDVSITTVNEDPNVEKERSLMKLRLEKLDLEAKAKNKNIELINESKKINQQTIEEATSRFMNNNFKRSVKEDTIRFWSEDKMCYCITEDDKKEVENEINKALDAMGANGFKSPRHIESISKYLMIQAVGMSNSVHFSEKYFCVNIRNNAGKLVKAYLSVEKELGKFYIRVIKPRKSLNCRYYLDNIVFDVEDIITKDKRFANFSDFSSDDDSYMVDIRYKHLEFYTEYLKNIFFNANFERMARITLGSYFTQRNLGKACYIPGVAGVGKSIFQTVIKTALEGVVMENLKIDTKDVNQFSNLKFATHTFGIVPESTKDVNTHFFKQILGGGGDTVKFEIKGGRQKGVQMDKVAVIVNSNYNELPVISADNDSFLRRMMCVKPTENKPKFEIENFYTYLLYGGEAISDGFEGGSKVFKGGACLSMFKWLLSGAIELMEMGSFHISKFGQEAIDFKAEIFQRMSSSSNFFEYFKIKDSDKGILKEHVLEIFKRFKNNNKYSDKKFDAEIKEEFFRATGKELRTARVMIEDSINLSNGQPLKFKQTATIYFVDFEGLKLSDDYYYSKGDVVDFEKAKKDRAMYSKIEKKVINSDINVNVEQELGKIDDEYSYNSSIAFMQ